MYDSRTICLGVAHMLTKPVVYDASCDGDATMPYGDLLLYSYSLTWNSISTELCCFSTSLFNIPMLSIPFSSFVYHPKCAIIKAFKQDVNVISADTVEHPFSHLSELIFD